MEETHVRWLLEGSLRWLASRLLLRIVEVWLSLRLSSSSPSRPIQFFQHDIFADNLPTLGEL